MGSVELRGDGALRDWRTVFNNGPEAPDGWNHKVTAQMEDSLFAVSLGGTEPPILLRTQLPPSLANDSAAAQMVVDQLTYEGAFPVSRLTAADRRLRKQGGGGGLGLSLTAHGQFKVQDPAQSAAPAIVFDLTVDNTNGTADVSASAMFALPNIIGAERFSAATVGTPTPMLLLSEGTASIHRDGGMAITATTDGAELSSWSWASSNSGVGALLHSFATTGGGLTNNSQPSATTGALQASVLVPRGQTRVLTICLSWFFPHHIWDGDFATDLGNFYSTLYSSAEDVAMSAVANKAQSLQNALDYHAIYLETDLPLYLQDALINSAAVFYKTSQFQADGQFRMWESHSCADLQPPHIHFYRALALQTLFPSLERQIPIRTTERK
jgi:uncharacterized protein (DUF608 family)